MPYILKFKINIVVVGFCLKYPILFQCKDADRKLLVLTWSRKYNKYIITEISTPNYITKKHGSIHLFITSFMAYSSTLITNL